MQVREVYRTKNSIHYVYKRTPPSNFNDLTLNELLILHKQERNNKVKDRYYWIIYDKRTDKWQCDCRQFSIHCDCPHVRKALYVFKKSIKGN